MRILGIDPGLRITGYGCAAGRVGALRLVEGGVIRLVEGATRRPVAERLAELDQDLSALLDRLEPEAVAVEGLFAHYKHPATAVVMAHARGVVLLAVQRRGLPLVELKPAEVKKSLTGSGRASKEQMQRAVQQVFKLASLPEPADVADAIAIAACGIERLAVGAVRGLGR
ncbi:MAG: crossover junction endodeoxyribonuclease RuvC [Leptolyngbya sp. PLA3]|nr:MAG: crossover junction endodeoxyribonuclease RuvC [Cyanobacteria bacterium CYA]MCE7969546.1 crossover junction endodeoxyribonuclease RuvC [Leptolyngbya sp. PL-A3]